LPMVFFDTNKSLITKEQKDEMRETVVKFIKENPTVKLRINGHTDDIGNDRFNVTLSAKRAEAVYKFLLEEGVPKENLEVNSFGRAIPLYPPGYQGLDPEFARSRNRRVVFDVVGGDKKFIIKDNAEKAQ
ncbi:MAG TPA: OmpA family protein, partial [Luteibaculaceae bacterium]|nr:OmpA family protein [Luteibaculaceae bacterium]